MHVLSTPAARKLGASCQGEGPGTLLFLNGFGTEQSVWSHQVARFGRTHRVITFDHVGSGKSDIAAYSPDRYASLYDYADDVLALLDELDADDVVLVGHSAGAMVGLITADAEPTRCRGLVTIGASPRYLNEPDYEGGFDAAGIQAVLDAMEDDYQAWATGFSLQVAANPERPELAERYASFLKSMRPDIAQATLKTIFQSDLRAAVPRLTLPVLVIQCDADIAVPCAVGRYLAEHLPNATLVEIDFTGHLPHMLAPDAIGDLIERFLAREAETTSGGSAHGVR